MRTRKACSAASKVRGLSKPIMHTPRIRGTPPIGITASETAPVARTASTDCGKRRRSSAASVKNNGSPVAAAVRIGPSLPMRTWADLEVFAFEDDLGRLVCVRSPAGRRAER